MTGIAGSARAPGDRLRAPPAAPAATCAPRPTRRRDPGIDPGVMAGWACLPGPLSRWEPVLATQVRGEGRVSLRPMRTTSAAAVRELANMLGAVPMQA